MHSTRLGITAYWFKNMWVLLYIFNTRINSESFLNINSDALKSFFFAQVNLILVFLCSLGSQL